MRKVTMMIVGISLCALFTSCASDKTVKQGEMDAKKPINCATAEGDIRSLKSEKTTASEQFATGITTIVPVGLVVDSVEGKTGTNAKVAMGDYNKMLDDKIKEIQTKCGVQ